MNLTYDQVRGPLERVLLVGLGYLVARGYIAKEMVGDILTILLAGGAAFYGWWQNRPKAILQSAAAIVGEDGKKTLVVTSPEMAASTSESNIVSNRAAVGMAQGAAR